MSSPITCSNNSLTPEDFLRKCVRSDGSGNFALARIDVTDDGPWSELDCDQFKGITWKDILLMVANQDGDGKYAINTVDV